MFEKSVVVSLGPDYQDGKVTSLRLSTVGDYRGRESLVNACNR